MKHYHLQRNNQAMQNMVSSLSLIALFILLLAVINFVNINIGTSSYRLKEIGLRKVFGSIRLQLIVQFLVESLMLTILAAIISGFLYQLLIPIFNQLLHSSLEPLWNFDISKIVFLMILVAGIGLLSGIYPAYVLSGSETIRSVRGKNDSSTGGLLLRKSLLVVQFTLAIVVFISTLNISKQVSFFFNKDLGFNKDQVLIISSIPRKWDSAGIISMENIKSELLQVSQVRSATLSYDIPDGNQGGNVNVYTQHSPDFISMFLFAEYEDFAKVFGM
jgi:hypothetical protein